MFFAPYKITGAEGTGLHGTGWTDELKNTGAGTDPGGSISGMPGRNYARVFLHVQHPIGQNLKEAGDSIKSTVESVFKTH